MYGRWEHKQIENETVKVERNTSQEQISGQIGSQEQISDDGGYLNVAYYISIDSLDTMTRDSAVYNITFYGSYYGCESPNDSIEITYYDYND
jgi:hypothetical protein